MVLRLLGAIGAFMIFVTVMALVSMLVYKLVQAYRFLNDDEKITSLITRIVILGSISSPLSLIPGAAYSIKIYAASGTEIGEIASSTAHVIVLFTNCMCLLLSFSFYDLWYQRFCGCIHKRCYNYWSKKAQDRDMDRNIPELTEGVHSNSNPANSSKKDTIV